jgi:hypothetical protein
MILHTFDLPKFVCPKCNGTMVVSRRTHHPKLRNSYELVSFRCTSHECVEVLEFTMDEHGAFVLEGRDIPRNASASAIPVSWRTDQRRRA